MPIFLKKMQPVLAIVAQWMGGVMRILIVATLILAFGSTSFAACYTVYDKSDKPVYKSSEPPFDLSIPISEGITSKYPGGYLIQSSERASCYLRSKESNEALKKSKVAFENRRIQLQSQGFSEVRNDRTSVLSFPKEVVVGRPLNNSTLPINRGRANIDGEIDGLIMPGRDGGMVIGEPLNGSIMPGRDGGMVIGGPLNGSIMPGRDGGMVIGGPLNGSIMP